MATVMEPVPTRAIYGFALASSQEPSSSLPARAAAVTPQPMPGLTVKLPPTPQLSAHNTSKVHAATSVQHQPVQQAPAPATPSSADHLGWKGLLEISRNSGASGVLGGRQAPVEEVGPAKDTKIEICCTAHTGPAVKRLVKSVIRGLKACQEPERAAEGMGGTYFFANENGRKVAILKPCDEEPLAPNNPKGYVGRNLGDPGWKPTVRVGEAAMREVAAYLLDHEGFARVPTSVLVRARHPIFCYSSRMSSVRQSCMDLSIAGLSQLGGSSNLGAIADGVDAPLTPAPAASNPGILPEGSSSSLPMKLGSLQEFVQHECDTTEMGPSRFSVQDVHRIGILDIRLFNTDRHAGNMLVRHPRTTDSSSNLVLKARMPEVSQYELVPIDHGFCLPETLEAPYFEWLHWPQAMQPFSEDELEYIRKLDIEADKELLRIELPNLRPECLRVLEVSTTLLKRCAEAGLTLYEIGSIMTRPYEHGGEEASDLERFASAARAVVDTGARNLSGDIESDIGEDEDDDTFDDESDTIEEEDGMDSDEEMTSMAGHRRLLDGNQASLGLETSDMLIMGLMGDSGDAEAPGRGHASSRGDESMLFDLDDDSAGGATTLTGATSTGLLGGPMGRACMDVMGGRSPGADSLGSSSLSSDLDPHFCLRGTPRALLAAAGIPRAARLGAEDRGSAGGAAVPIMEGGGFNKKGMMQGSAARSSNMAISSSNKSAATAVPSPPAPAGAQYATSVHVTDSSFLHSHMRARKAAQMRNKHAKRHGNKLTPSPQAYPPPVLTCAPDALNGLFSEMDESQWSTFMEHLSGSIDEAIRSGRWRQSLKKDSSVAHSCRF